MPNPKRRRFLNQQRQKRRAKLSKTRYAATRPDRDVLENERNSAWEKSVKGHEFIIKATANPKNWSTLEQVEQIHGIRFSDVMARMKRKFPRQVIQVLDAGSGESSLAGELQSPCVRVHRSDIRKINASHEDFHQVSTNRLLDYFGRNKFHLIIETFGATISGGSFRAALANIYAVLKQGGEAYIALSHEPNKENPYFAKIVRELKIPFKWTKQGLIIYK